MTQAHESVAAPEDDRGVESSLKPTRHMLRPAMASVGSGPTVARPSAALICLPPRRFAGTADAGQGSRRSR